MQNLRAQLTRTIVEHKADLSPEAARESDQAILDRIDDITALLLHDLTVALAEDDADWFNRYGWFVDLLTAMLEKSLAEPPDE